MMRTGRLLALMAAVLLCAGLLGCSKNKVSPKKAIAVIPKGTTHIYWKSVHDGAEVASKETGYKVIWTGPERETDREKQVQIVEDFITQGVAGVVLAPLDSKALVPSVEKLQEKKIPCVIIDSEIDTDKYMSFIATDNYQGGVIAARRMGEILGGKGNILVLKYMPGSGSTTMRENGFIDTIKKEFKSINIVDTKYANDTVESALQATEDLLTRNKDIQGMFACNASSSVGALQALQSQKRGEVKLIGFDAEKALVDGVQGGQIDSIVVQNPFKMGYEGVKAIVAIIEGKKVQKRVDTGVVLVTKENMRQPEIADLLKTQ